MKELQERLLKVQSELKAPKNQRNNFGKYNYRSCEDILEAVKPLLAKHGLLITIADQVHEAGSYMYVESTVMVSYEGDRLASTAQAGIDPNRKGMDIAQSFGSSSSYARKYALNGMFLIDDTKDADATNTHGNVTKTVTKKKATKQVISAMKKAVTEGNKQAVIDKITDYELSEQDVMDIMKGE
jgi:hypothetical protein